MPARSCQCPERRAPIASRRWEVCSKPGDGSAVIHCKACGAIWTTRAKFADTMPYDIGPVTFAPEGYQHSRCDVALVGISAILLAYKDASNPPNAPKIFNQSSIFLFYVFNIALGSYYYTDKASLTAT